MGIVLVQAKIARGLKQIRDGNYITNEQMQKEFIEREDLRRKR